MGLDTPKDDGGVFHTPASRVFCGVWTCLLSGDRPCRTDPLVLQIPPTTNIVATIFTTRMCTHDSRLKPKSTGQNSRSSATVLDEGSHIQRRPSGLVQPVGRWSTP